jgi:glycerol 2-dehydrogenase (NADP+)
LPHDISLYLWHWKVAKGAVILPKSVTPARITSNYKGAIAAVEKMDNADIQKLDGVAIGGKQKRLVSSP